jgi:LysM repeat protein
VAEVPFVKPQGVRPDGSIIHIVQEGDTLSSIAYAYSVDYGVTIDSIVALNSGLKRNTRFLTLGQEIVILAPGSVDPKTGRLLPAGATTTPGAATPAGTGTQPADDASPIPSPTPVSNPAAVSSATPRASATAKPSATPVSTVPQNTQPLPSIGSTEQAAEPTEEVAAELTEAPTEQPAAETPTSVPTLEPAATATLEPSVAPSPSATAEAVAEAGIAAESGTLCVTVYQDANLNGVRDADETPAAAAEIAIAQRGSAETAYQYDGATAPLCLDLLPGQYQVSARLPSGWGMTTADAAAVSLVSGRQVSVILGGAEGYEPPAAPQGSGELPTVETGAVAPMVTVVVQSDQAEKSALDRLYDNSGLLVLAFAGVVVVSSTVLLLVLRRFTR